MDWYARFQSAGLEGAGSANGFKLHVVLGTSIVREACPSV